MLLYASTGIRDFGNHPLPPHARTAWEFYAAIRGAIAPTFPHRPESSLAESRIWLFPPGLIHGWRAAIGEKVRIVAFHYSAVPPALAETLTAEGCRSRSLSPDECIRLYRLGKEAASELHSGSALHEFYSQRVLMELTMLLLSEPKAVGSGGASPEERVATVERLYREMLATRPTASRVACAVGLSTGHLSRIIQAVRGCGLRELLQRIQLEEVKRVLIATDTKLEVVAQVCGFQDAAALCRAFKRSTGMTPAEFRRNVGGSSALFFG